MRHSSPLGVGLAACPLFAHPAAAPVDVLRHFRAVASNDVEALLGAYADGATMRWSGGGLDGVHAGAAQLRALWLRFAAEHGRLELVDAEVHENANPRAATVTAGANYRGRDGSEVRLLVVVRHGRIVSEVCELESALALAAT